MNNLHAYLALNHISGLGPITIMKLKKKWPLLQDIFKLPPHALVESGLSFKQAHAISHFDFNLLQPSFQFLEQPNQHILTLEDENYPPLLKEIYDPPVVIYAKGDLKTLKAPTIAMVGTRKPTPLALENAFEFAKGLAQHQITTISGLAHGVDAAAHRGSLAGRGATVAVMGTGINTIYPRQNKALAAQILENGLLLSEFPLNTPPNAGHFPRRNRIISGLSLCTLVVEAAIKSGSLITARFALEQNREVMAIPSHIRNTEAQGCLHLIQQGATLVSSVDDIIFNLGLKPINQSKSPVQNRIKHPILEALSEEITPIDVLSLRTGLQFEDLIAQLTQLEVQGKLSQVPGGYVRCWNENNNF